MPLGNAGSLVLGRKRAGKSPVVALATGLKDSLLFVWNKNSGRQFLVDTRTEFSLPPCLWVGACTGELGPPLMAGCAPSHYIFHLASMSGISLSQICAILLGADFLCSNSLLVDLKGKRQALGRCRDLLFCPFGLFQDICSSS